MKSACIVLYLSAAIASSPAVAFSTAKPVSMKLLPIRAGTTYTKEIDVALNSSNEPLTTESPTEMLEPLVDSQEDIEPLEEQQVDGFADKLSVLKNSGAAQSAVAVFAGTMLTYLFNNNLALGPIRASSLIGLTGAVALPANLALATLCGSFAGMARGAVIPGLLPAAVLGLSCASIMAMFDRKKLFIGVGGRLGFIAQCACTLQFIISSMLPSAPSAAALLGRYSGIGNLMLGLPKVVFFTLVGAFGMTYWKEIFESFQDEDSQSPLISRLASSSAAVGAIGLLGSLLPVAAAGPIYCGTFIAMASPARLPTFGSLIGASITAGISQQALSGALLGGWGGKLGTSAFLGVVTYMALARFFGNGSLETKLA